MVNILSIESEQGSKRRNIELHKLERHGVPVHVSLIIEILLNEKTNTAT